MYSEDQINFIGNMQTNIEYSGARRQTKSTWETDIDDKAVVVYINTNERSSCGCRGCCSPYKATSRKLMESRRRVCLLRPIECTKWKRTAKCKCAKVAKWQRNELKLRYRSIKKYGDNVAISIVLLWLRRQIKKCELWFCRRSFSIYFIYWRFLILKQKGKKRETIISLLRKLLFVVADAKPHMILLSFQRI